MFTLIVFVCQFLLIDILFDSLLIFIRNYLFFAKKWIGIISVLTKIVLNFSFLVILFQQLFYQIFIIIIINIITCIQICLFFFNIFLLRRSTRKTNTNCLLFIFLFSLRFFFYWLVILEKIFFILLIFVLHSIHLLLFNDRIPIC